MEGASIGTWACPSCTYANPSSFLACEVCRTQRPAAKPVIAPANDGPSSKWSCPACTFENPSGSTACGVCGTRRPAAQTPQPSDPRPSENKGGGATEGKEESVIKLTQSQQGRNRGNKWKRNSNVVGTLEMRCFQKSIAHPEHDPLQIPRFAFLGFCCVPLVGIYDADYQFAQPKVLLEMPSDNLHLLSLSEDLKEALLGQQPQTADQKSRDDAQPRAEGKNHASPSGESPANPQEPIPGYDPANPHLSHGRVLGETDEDRAEIAARRELTAAERAMVDGKSLNTPHGRGPHDPANPGNPGADPANPGGAHRFSDSDTEDPPLLPARGSARESKGVWHNRLSQYRAWNTRRIERCMGIRRMYLEWDREYKHDPAFAYRNKEQKWTDAKLAEAKSNQAAAASDRKTTDANDEFSSPNNPHTPTHEGKNRVPPPSHEHGGYDSAPMEIDGHAPNPGNPANNGGSDYHGNPDGSGDVEGGAANPGSTGSGRSFGEDTFVVIMHRQIDVKRCRSLAGAVTDDNDQVRWRVNVVPHLWAFPDCPFREEDNVESSIEIGIFDAHGLIASDGTNPDDLIENRLITTSVNVHDRHFSPNNCCIYLDPDADYASFFLLCHSQNRRILSFHVIPISDEFSRGMSAITGSADHLETVLASLMDARNTGLQDAGKKVSDIVTPFLGF